MRRIIERVVTVVTTTTWKIYWQEEATSSYLPSEAVGDEFSEPVIPSETVRNTRPFPPETEEKEVNVWINEPVTKQATDELQDEPYFRNDKERK